MIQKVVITEFNIMLMYHAIFVYKLQQIIHKQNLFAYFKLQYSCFKSL